MTADSESESSRPARLRRRRRALRVPIEGVPKPIAEVGAAESQSRTNRPSEPTKPIKQRASSPDNEKETKKAPKRSRKETRPLGGKSKRAAVRDVEDSVPPPSTTSVDWDEVSRPSGPDIDENTLPDDPPTEDEESDKAAATGESAEVPLRASNPDVVEGAVAAGLVAVGESPASLLKAPKQRRHISEPPPPMAGQDASSESSDTHEELQPPPETSAPETDELPGSDTIMQSAPLSGAEELSPIDDDEDLPPLDEVLPPVDTVVQESAPDHLTMEAAEDGEGERLSLPEILEIEEPAPTPPTPSNGAAGPSAPPPPPKETPPARAEAPITEPVERRGWFEDLFDRNYQRTVRPRTPKQVARECDFILARLDLEIGSRILDLGCGEGMHVAEMASRGYEVVGVDLSSEMIRQARAEAEDREVDVELIERDMRNLEFEGEFDAVICWNAVFGYFTDDENRNAIREIHRALRPGGRLLLDVVNRDYAIGQHPNFVWFEGDDCVCMEETGFNFIASRLQVSRTIILHNSQQLSQKYTLRLYSLHELGQLLHHQGFRVAEVSGQESTPAAFFGDVSPRMIVLAERRVSSSDPA